MQTSSLAAMAAQAGGPPFDSAAVPVTVHLSADKSTLTVRWADGEPVGLRSAGLRVRCRCAWCTRARCEGTFPDSFPGVRVTDVQPLGGYAVHLQFSDGHARGIFPWTYLRELARDGNLDRSETPAPRSLQP